MAYSLGVYLQDINSNPLSFSGTKFPLNTKKNIFKKIMCKWINAIQDKFLC